MLNYRELLGDHYAAAQMAFAGLVTVRSDEYDQRTKPAVTLNPARFVGQEPAPQNDLRPSFTEFRPKARNSMQAKKRIDRIRTTAHAMEIRARRAAQALCDHRWVKTGRNTNGKRREKCPLCQLNRTAKES